MLHGDGSRQRHRGVGRVIAQAGERRLLLRRQRGLRMVFEEIVFRAAGRYKISHDSLPVYGCLTRSRATFLHLYRKNKKGSLSGRPIAGGEGGIRTLDSLIGYTRFRDGPVQPLRHLSNVVYYNALSCRRKSPIFTTAAFDLGHLDYPVIPHLPHV